MGVQRGPRDVQKTTYRVEKKLYFSKKNSGFAGDTFWSYGLHVFSFVTFQKLPMMNQIESHESSLRRHTRAHTHTHAHTLRRI